LQGFEYFRGARFKHRLAVQVWLEFSRYWVYVPSAARTLHGHINCQHQQILKDFENGRLFRIQERGDLRRASAATDLMSRFDCGAVTGELTRAYEKAHRRR
jgi:hypothetical protein